MILEIIMFGLGYLITAFGSLLPGNGQVPFLLPWGTDEWFSQGITGYKILAASFPPMGVVFTAFLIYIGFKIVVQILKAVPILGRTLS